MGQWFAVRGGAVRLDPIEPRHGAEPDQTDVTFPEMNTGIRLDCTWIESEKEGGRGRGEEKKKTLLNL